MENILLFYMLFAWAFFGLIAMYMAEQRGRNQLLGFLSGAVFGFLGVLYYLLAGDTLEVRVKKELEVKKKLGVS